jgi:hypothetical protein
MIFIEMVDIAGAQAKTEIEAGLRLYLFLEKFAVVLVNPA